MAWPFSRLPGYRSRVEYGDIEDFKAFQRKLREAFWVVDHMKDGDVVQVSDHVWLMKRDGKYYLIQAETGQEAEITYNQAHTAAMYGIAKGYIAVPPEAGLYIPK